MPDAPGVAHGVARRGGLGVEAAGDDIIPGHGNVVGFGQALTQEAKELEVYQGKNEQGMAQAAVAFAKQMKRKQILKRTRAWAMVKRMVSIGIFLLEAL